MSVSNFSSETNIRLSFIGSPLLDIAAKCSSENLSKLNLKQGTCVIATNEHEDLLHTLFNDPDSHKSAGGSALNSARIAKWVISKKGEVSFIGCAGDDIYKEWLDKTLAKENVHALHIPMIGMKTGVCACLVTEEGERTMVTRHGAAAHLSVEHLNLDPIKEELSESDCVFIVGYLLNHSSEVVHKITNSCSVNQTIALSLSAEYICKKYNKDLQNLIPRINILLGNESEVLALAKTFSGQHSLTVPECLKIIQTIPKSTRVSKRLVVITRGSDPVVVDDDSGNLQYFKVPPNVPVKDTIGCGDAFAGAFVANYSMTKCLKSSVECGIKAAVEISQMKGCNIPQKRFQL